MAPNSRRCNSTVLDVSRQHSGVPIAQAQLEPAEQDCTNKWGRVMANLTEDSEGRLPSPANSTELTFRQQQRRRVRHPTSEAHGIKWGKGGGEGKQKGRTVVFRLASRFYYPLQCTMYKNIEYQKFTVSKRQWLQSTSHLTVPPGQLHRRLPRLVGMEVLNARSRAISNASHRKP